MSADWIKMRVDLKTHPKTVRISSALSTDTFRVVGGLHAMWSVFDKHTVDGLLHGYTLESMDDAINWPGFSKAVADEKWLIMDIRRGLLMPDFVEHNGQSAKRRAEDQKRKRDARRGQHDGGNQSAQEADKLRTGSGLEKEKEKEKEVIQLPAAAAEAALLANFETLWAAYPARPGRSKANALKAYRARIKEGSAPDQILAGVKAYADYCVRFGTQSNFIKQPETFLGPGKHFLSDWSPIVANAMDRHTSRDWANPNPAGRSLADAAGDEPEPIEGSATLIPEETEE